MAKILQFVRTGALDANATGALAKAYEQALAALDGVDRSATVREIIARRIISAAKKGETDPDRLCQTALATLARLVGN